MTLYTPIWQLFDLPEALARRAEVWLFHAPVLFGHTLRVFWIKGNWPYGPGTLCFTHAERIS